MIEISGLTILLVLSSSRVKKNDILCKFYRITKITTDQEKKNLCIKMISFTWWFSWNSTNNWGRRKNALALFIKHFSVFCIWYGNEWEANEHHCHWCLLLYYHAVFFGYSCCFLFLCSLLLFPYWSFFVSFVFVFFVCYSNEINGIVHCKRLQGYTMYWHIDYFIESMDVCTSLHF